MAKTLIKGALLGGIVLFLWNWISWSAIPWHTATLRSFSDEAAVVAALQANAPRSGIYLAGAQAGPTIFLSYCTGGFASMTRPLILSFLQSLIVGLLVTALLLRTRGLSYWGRVGFVTLAAFTAAVACFLPPWIWFGFAADYTLVMVADLIIAGFLVGLVLAKWASPEPA